MSHNISDAQKHTLASHVRLYQATHGGTYAELGRMWAISSNVISPLIRGVHTGPISHFLAERFSKAMDIPIETLLGPYSPASLGASQAEGVSVPLHDCSIVGEIEQCVKDISFAVDRLWALLKELKGEA